MFGRCCYIKTTGVEELKYSMPVVAGSCCFWKVEVGRKKNLRKERRGKAMDRT
jgi:hypothetical protein